MQRIDDGLKSVPKMDLTFSSSNIPIQIELRPKPDAASNENADHQKNVPTVQWKNVVAGKLLQISNI